MFYKLLIAADFIGALPIVRWLFNSNYSINYKNLLPLIGIALVFLFHSFRGSAELIDSIYFFFILLALIFVRPQINTRDLSNVFPIILAISFIYVLFMYLGFFDPADVDYFRGSGIYVLRFPFKEPGHFALVLGSIEILLFLLGKKPRISVLFVILTTGSLMSILIILIIVAIKIYREPKFLIFMSFFIFISFIIGYYILINSSFYESISRFPILLRVESVIAGNDVSVLRRLVYPLENFINDSFITKMLGKGYGNGYPIESIFYTNPNFVPNNLYFSILSQYGILGLISLFLIYKQNIQLNKFLVIMTLFVVNGYIFTSVNLFIILLYKSKIIK